MTAPSEQVTKSIRSD